MCLLSCHKIKPWLNNIVGCVPSAPDGSSPRGYSRIFLGIDSKNDSSFTRFNFLLGSLIFPHISSLSWTTFRLFILLMSTTIIVFSSCYPYTCDVINTINLVVIISCFWPLPMGSVVISQSLCLLVGYRFCSLRYVSAHVPLPGSYIRGEWGKSMFTSSSLLPPPPLLQSLRSSDLLHNPHSQIIDVHEAPGIEE
jgi:hypothetical protein